MNWSEAACFATPIRERVFLKEQAIPKELEWDGLDDDATHAIAFDSNGQAIGYARLLPTRQLGRMAVLRDHRHLGVGTALLLALEQTALQLRYDHIFLHAQLQALPFYEQQGYQSQGELFNEADIPHILMEKPLANLI